MTAATRSATTASRNTAWANNTTRAITPTILRAQVENLSDSVVFPEDLRSYLGKQISTVALFWADSALTYTADQGQSTVAAGDMVFAGKQMLPFEIAASGASDQDGTTAGGVKFYIHPAFDGRFHSASWNISQNTNETVKLQAFLTKAAGRDAVWNTGSYISDRLTISTGTTLEFEAGTVWTVLTGGVGGIYINNSSNIRVYGNGSRIYADNTQSSHTILIQKSSDVDITDFVLEGSGNTGDDIVYIGGAPAEGPTGICHRIRLRRLVGSDPGRNGISVAAGWDVLIEDCHMSDAVTASPQAGIGIEANVWMADGQNAAKRITIRRCSATGCAGSGMYVTFGSEVTFEDCNFYDNTGVGLSLSTSGNPHETDKYKAGWLLAVSAMDETTGWWTVAPVGTDITDDYDVREGMLVSRRKRGTGEFPAEIASITYTFVNEISSDGRSIRLGEYYGVNTFTSYALAPIGTLTEDPTTSDLYFEAYLPGHGDKIKILNSRFWGNTGINLSASVMHDFVVSGCTFDKPTSNAIKVQYAHKYTIENNIIDFAPAATSTSKGINAASCGPGAISGNRVLSCPDAGINVSGCTDLRMTNNEVIDSGYSAVDSVSISNGTRVQISGLKIRNSAGKLASGGLALTSTAIDALVSMADCTDAGTTNGNSLSVPASATVTSSRRNDGSFYP